MKKRRNPEPVFVPANDCELWIFSVIIIISCGVDSFLEAIYSARYIYVWCCLKTEEKRNFAIKVFREKFKEDGE